MYSILRNCTRHLGHLLKIEYGLLIKKVLQENLNCHKGYAIDQKDSNVNKTFFIYLQPKNIRNKILSTEFFLE